MVVAYNPDALPVPAGHSACLDCPAVMLCRCLRVTVDEVREVVSTHGARNVSEIAQHTGAGSGCTACHRRLRQVIVEQRTQLVVADPSRVSA
jgi:bacterioferritin-associated ferredoxin